MSGGAFGSLGFGPASWLAFGCFLLWRGNTLYFLPLPRARIIASGLAIVVNDLEMRRMHSLYSTLLADATFHELLLVFDQDIAISARRNNACCAEGCSFWPLSPQSLAAVHLGSARSTIGASASVVPANGCRTPGRPPSFRFLGRKVYLGRNGGADRDHAEGATAARMRQLSALVGVAAGQWTAGECGGRDTSRRTSGRSVGPHSCAGRSGPPAASLIERSPAAARSGSLPLAALHRPDHWSDRHAR